jgi:hypothetical protein
MSISRTRKIRFVGFANSGKEELLKRINDLKTLPDSLRDYYSDFARPSTIYVEKDINDITYNPVVVSFCFVFCINTAEAFHVQFNAIKNILQNHPNEPYWLYVFGAGVLNVPTLKNLILEKIEHQLKFFTPEMGRPQILLSTCNDKELESFVQATLVTTPVNKVEEEKTEEQTHLDNPNYSYCDAFDKLDNTDVSGFTPLEIKILKQSMTKTVKDILEKIHDDNEYNTNLDSYNEYIELFNKVTNSKILSAHNRYPTLDKIFKKKFLGTQQKLLGMIRADALNELHSKVNDEDVDQADLLQTINDAKTKPIFNMHRSNLPTLFRPDQTNAFKTLSQLAAYVIERIKNIVRPAV